MSPEQDGPSAVVDVVLPVLDEAEALPWVLERMPPGFRPIVVDNGSTDGSADIARSYGAVVVTEPVPGFGSACYAGLQACTSAVMAFMDADASLDPGDLPSVVRAVQAGEADLVMGSRQHAPGAWPLHARLANRVLAAELRRRCGIGVTDLGPMRAMRRDALLSLDLQDRRFGWPLEMVVKGVRAQWRIEEVPVQYLPRLGRSKITGTIRGTARAVGDMSAVLRTT